MIYFDRTNVSERTDVNKTSVSKDCDICHYWYFLNVCFKFQSNICHDLLMISMNLSINAKCWFGQKKQSIIKHKQFIFICKSG